jgi:carboxyl-terminal processing protease
MRLALLSRGVLALAMSCPLLHAQQAAPAGVAVVDEIARKIQERSFFTLNTSLVYDGVLAAARKRSGDDAAAIRAESIARLPGAEAAAQFRTRMQALAERPGQRMDLLELAEAGIADYCRSIDRWSHYVSIQDTSRIEQFRKADSIGIGVNLRDESGTIYCHPYPESQALLAGITSGDKLISVDGRPVEGRPLELIAAWIKGVPGTQTTGRTQLITALREAVKMPTVMVERDITGTLVKIRSFDKDTATQITDALKDVPQGRRLTFDLRGCGGGWMLAAVDVARLIVPPGKVLLTHLERGSARQDFMSTEPKLRPGNIAILQDNGTGSAAEILIAALVENLPAQVVSRGERTHGKGVVQELIPLSGGGQLVLTTGMIFGPGGRTWDGKGLLPSFDHEGPGAIYPAGAATLPPNLPAVTR